MDGIRKERFPLSDRIADEHAYPAKSLDDIEVLSVLGELLCG